MTRRRCAVLGSPIAHSLSPALHRAAYAELGLDWSYDAVEVTEEGLAAFLDGLDPTWRGLSLTMPLKRAVVPLLDELGPEAELARAANTVLVAEGRRTGHNTDVPGSSAAVRERYDGPVDRAVIVGGGATAASMARKLGWSRLDPAPGASKMPPGTAPRRPRRRLGADGGTVPAGAAPSGAEPAAGTSAGVVVAASAATLRAQDAPKVDFNTAG